MSEKYPDYLIQWRLSLWASIRHKELIIWSFIGFYATANGIILGAGHQYISPLTQVFAVTTLSLLGIHVVLDATSWNARNLFSISRIEKRFVGGEAGVLIPLAYLNPTFRYNMIYAVQVFFVAGLPWLSCFRYGWQHIQAAWTTGPLPPFGGLPVASALTVGFLLLIRLAGSRYRLIYFRFREGFDRDVDGTPLPPPTNAERATAMLNDPTWIVSATGLSLTLAALDVATAVQTRRSWLLYASATLLIAVVLFHAVRSVSQWFIAAPPMLPSAMDRVNWLLGVGSTLIIAVQLGAKLIARADIRMPFA